MNTNWLRQTPVIRLLLPYLAGICWLNGSPRWVCSLLLTGLWLLWAYHFASKRLPSAWRVRWMPGLAYGLFWMSLGGIASQVCTWRAAFPKGETVLTGARISVVREPEEKARSYTCEVVVIQPQDTACRAWKGKHLLLYLEKDDRWKQLHAGDGIDLQLSPENLKEGQGSGEFDYASWLRKKGICGTDWIPAASWDGRIVASSFSFRGAAERARQVLIHRFESAGMDGQELALISALALGKSSMLDGETKQDFSVAGVSHILSVSGLHVGVIYWILAWLLQFLLPGNRWRIPRQLLLVLMLFGYAFLTGLSPSVLRSALMFSLVALGKCLSRKSQTLNTVLFSALVLLIWNPFYLYDLGFRLSYAAVLSIVVLHPRLSGLVRFQWKPVQSLWEMLCLSLVAQLGTAPLTVSVFHLFPAYFLLNNMVAVPWSSLLIYGAMAFLPLADVPWMGPLLSRLLKVLTHGFLGLADAMSGWPSAQLGPWFMSGSEVLLGYLLLTTLSVWLLWRRRRWVLPFLLCLLSWQSLQAALLFFEL